MADILKHGDKHDHEPGRSIVARFHCAAEAREAIAALHKAHYTHTWLGVTSVAVTSGGDEAVTVESGGFFSKSESLVDALVSHGVLGNTAREIERTLEPGDALLTVDPKDRDALEATSLLEQHGGHVAGHGADAATDLWLAPSRPRTSTPSITDPGVDDGAHDTFVQRSKTPR